jgi:ribose transport system permease protein
MTRTLIRLLGIAGVVVVLFVAMLLADKRAATPENLGNVAELIGARGVLALGVGLLIIAGGIDLSIGSVVGLSAVGYALLIERGVDGWTALVVVLALAPLTGLVHGLLVTKLRLQPFLVTLCGLFIYRGLARWMTWTRSGSSRDVSIAQHMGELETLSYVFVGRVGGVPLVLLLVLALAGVFALLLHGTVWGRYLYAIGANEQAARYAGINTDRYKILAYMICSLMAGLGGVIYIFYAETANPTNAGNWFELYAITAAVLGGCSLRGGEGTVAGMLLGAAALPLLQNFCFFYRIPDDLIFTFFGVALLLGTVADEVLKRLLDRYRRAGAAPAAPPTAAPPAARAPGAASEQIRP